MMPSRKLAGEAETDDSEISITDRLAEHCRLGLDPADAPARARPGH